MNQAQLPLIAAIALILVGVVTLVTGSTPVGVLFIAAGVLFVGAARRGGGA